jgi:hypothetical protein
MPESGTVAAVAMADDAMLRLPVEAPEAVGAKTRLATQLAPPASEVPHVVSAMRK